MKHMVPCLCCLAMLLLLQPCPLAADEGEQKAVAEYEKGVAAFQEERYEDALAAFTISYNLSGKVDLLYNLAVCSEKTGNPEKAKAFYELYLEEKPDAEDADQVRRRLAVLNGEAPPSEEKPDETAQAPPKPEESDDAEKTDDAELAAREEEVEWIPPEEEEREVFWPGVIMGAGALVVASGTLTAIMAYKKHGDLEESCAPDCTDGQVSEVKNVAVAADVQLIVGAAAVTAGVVWWLLDRRERRESQVAVLPTPLADEGGGLILRGSF